MEQQKKTTIVLFSGDYDKAMVAILLQMVRGVRSRGNYFSYFWGLNALRKDEHVKVKKTFIEKVFGK